MGPGSGGTWPEAIRANLSVLGNGETSSPTTLRLGRLGAGRDSVARGQGGRLGMGGLFEQGGWCMVLTVPDDEFPREPQMSDGPAPGDRGKTNVAIRASRIRSRLVFTLIDAFCVFVGYGLAEIAYFRDKAPGLYWEHFAPFLRRGHGPHPGGQPRLRPVRPDVATRRGRGGQTTGPLGRHRGQPPDRRLSTRAGWGRSSWCRWR